MSKDRINNIDKRLELGNGMKMKSWNIRILNKRETLKYVLNVVKSYIYIYYRYEELDS